MATIKNNIVENVILNNNITVDGMTVKSQQATINSTNPEDMVFSEWTSDKELYKEHRVEIRSLEAEFEDYAFARQEEMIAVAGEHNE